MNIPGLGTTTYPATGYTSSGVLFSSLGSFWTRVFGDKEAIRGLTIGQSEELIQRYYDFVESLNALSVKKIEPLHKERWLPIKIRKSQVRLAPLKFLPFTDPDHAVLGAQPLPGSSAETNNYYHYGETFQFGRAKRPSENRHRVRIDPAIKKLPVLADRIVAPSKVLTSGIDYWLEDGELYFAKNPFDSEEFLRYELFNDSGSPLTFVWQPDIYSYSDTDAETNLGPAAGTVFNEEELVLWAYHGQLDTNALYDNFGGVFNLPVDEPEVYKRVLENTANLLVEGPTIKAITGLAAAFLNVPITQDPDEVLLDAYSVDSLWYVITDKRVYTASTFYNLTDHVYHTDANPALQGVRVGAKLPAGTPLFDAVMYYDNVSSPGWWNTELTRLILPGSMFMGSYDGVLIFENMQAFVDRGDDEKLRYTPDIINTEPGRILFPFPPTVTQADQDAFNDYISDPSRYATVDALIQASLNLSGNLNPLNFIFSHFMKTNSAMLRIRFQTTAQAARFAQVFHLIKNCLPSYVYTIFDFDVTMPQDTLTVASNTTDSSTLSSDGSDLGGWVQVPPYNLPPWRVRFGLPVSVLDTIRPFTLSRTLDLVNKYTNGYGTFYQYTNGLTGTNNIVADVIDFSASWTDGSDAGNIPIAYRLTGTIQVVFEGLGVTGSGTKFTTELSVGDLVYTAGDTKEYREITAINSDTSLSVKTAFSGNTRTLNLYVAHATPRTSTVSGLLFLSL